MIPMLYKPFRKWAERGSVYIISDPHFDDADCKLMDKNWITPQEHIDIINKVVRKNDTLVCLGDCGNLEWFDKIKAGYKVLIKGNHDDKGNDCYLKAYPHFSYKRDYTKFEVQCLLLEKGYKVLKIVDCEDSWVAFIEKGCFDEVYDGPVFIAPKILLSHEPIKGLDWCVNIHGHDHSCWTDVGVNLAANVYNFQVFNLGEEIKKGLVSKIHDIHRTTIDKAIERKDKEWK